MLVTFDVSQQLKGMNPTVRAILGTGTRKAINTIIDKKRKETKPETPDLQPGLVVTMMVFVFVLDVKR